MTLEFKNINQFRGYIKAQQSLFLNRCHLINLLMGIKENWSYIFRAFLFCSDTRVIDKNYLLQKIDYVMFHTSGKQSDFMDKWRKNIFLELRDCCIRGFGK